MPKRLFSSQQNKSKTSKIANVIDVINEYTSKILGQDVSICPLFGQ